MNKLQHINKSHHLFIINPVAGKKDLWEGLKKRIQNIDFKEKFTIKITKRVNHAAEIVKEFMENTKEFVKIYSCGGDGTLHEIINGVHGYKNCAVGVIPIGSGNDFVRCFKGFTNKELINNLNYTINGEIKEIDLIKYNDKLAINVVSAGYDCAVAKNMVKFKDWPFVTGEMAYKISLVYCSITEIKHNFTLYIDDKKINNNDKPYLLAVASNGQYYGGGFRVNPYSKLDSGYMDVIYVPTISRITFIKMAKIYKNGEHINNPKLPFINYVRCKKLKIESKENIDITLDGEIFSVKDPEISILPKVQKIIWPKRL